MVFTVQFHVQHIYLRTHEELFLLESHLSSIKYVSIKDQQVQVFFCLFKGVKMLAAKQAKLLSDLNTQK